MKVGVHVNWNAIDKYAKSLIKEAGHRIRVSFYSSISIDTKSSANDLVTNIDREIEQFFIQNIRTQFPSHRIMGEEGFGDEIKDLKGAIWFIDPIDGTMNFVHQKRNFAISMAVYLDGIGYLGYIYDVMRDDLYHAVKGEGAYFNDERLPVLENSPLEECMIGINAVWATPNQKVEHEPLIEMIRNCRGTRSYGSAAIELAYVVTGRMDAYISMRLAPWDVAAGMILAKEVGALSSTIEGKPLSLLQTESFIVAKPGLQQHLLKHYIQPKK